MPAAHCRPSCATPVGPQISDFPGCVYCEVNPNPSQSCVDIEVSRYWSSEKPICRHLTGNTREAKVLNLRFKHQKCQSEHQTTEHPSTGVVEQGTTWSYAWCPFGHGVHSIYLLADIQCTFEANVVVDVQSLTKFNVSHRRERGMSLHRPWHGMHADWQSMPGPACRSWDEPAWPGRTLSKTWWAGVAALLFGLVFLHGFPMFQRPTWLRDGRPKDTKRHPTTLGSTLGIGCNKVWEPTRLDTVSQRTKWITYFVHEQDSCISLGTSSRMIYQSFLIVSWSPPLWFSQHCWSPGCSPWCRRAWGPASPTLGSVEFRMNWVKGMIELRVWRTDARLCLNFFDDFLALLLHDIVRLDGILAGVPRVQQETTKI